MRYAAGYCEYLFTVGELETLKLIRKKLDAACALTGRNVGAISAFIIVAAETDEEAAKAAQHYIDATDVEALRNMYNNAALDKVAAQKSKDPNWTGSSGLLESLITVPRVEFTSDKPVAIVNGYCFEAPAIVGSYKHVAAYLDMLEKEGASDGVVMTFPKFVDGIKSFASNIMPHMVSRK
jgi:pyrimidine oxygenase